MKHTYVQETSKLAKSADGTYRVRIITEGEGSSGRYSRQLIESSQDVFPGALSFLNHPIDPEKPWLRDVNTIAGRFVGDVTAEESDKGLALFSSFEPRNAEIAQFIDKYGDAIGVSIYCGAKGEVMEDGRLDVESFNALDPYKSVDIVIAAGRGGQFERAREELRAIESSLGMPQSNKPESPSGSDSTHTQEVHMDPKELKSIVAEALAEALTPVTTFFAAEEARRAAEAAAKDKGTETADAVEAYAKASKAIADAKLLPSREAELLEAAKRGEDVVAAIEAAKKDLAEFEERAGSAVSEGYIHTPTGGESHDWSIARLGGN